MLWLVLCCFILLFFYLWTANIISWLHPWMLTLCASSHNLRWSTWSFMILHVVWVWESEIPNTCIILYIQNNVDQKIKLPLYYFSSNPYFPSKLLLLFVSLISSIDLLPGCLLLFLDLRHYHHLTQTLSKRSGTRNICCFSFHRRCLTCWVFLAFLFFILDFQPFYFHPVMALGAKE